MGQNWWDAYPEIEPSPAAWLPRMPGPNGAMPALPLLPPALLNAPLDPIQRQPSSFGPRSLPGDAAANVFPAPPSIPAGAGTIDPQAAIQQAGAAIRRGADPNAVRARLSQFGVDSAVLDAPDHFSDLIPAGPNTGAGDIASPVPPRPELSGFGSADMAPGHGPVSDDKVLPLSFKSAADNKVYPPVSQHHFRVINGPGFGGPRNPPQPQRSYPVAVQNLPGGINGHGYRPVPGDAELLARLIYSESGTTPGDMPAIGWAAINRVGFPHHAGPAFGSTLSEVVFQRARHGRYQYSFLNDGGSQAWNESANPANIQAASRARWAQANAVANGILTGRIRDPSGGAQYFFASPRYVPGYPDTASSGFPPMLKGNRIAPTPYQSTSTVRVGGRPLRNYFFRENPEKMWLPDPSTSPRR